MTRDVGTFIAYEAWSPSKTTQELLDRANVILARYEGQGYIMTLRQLHYALNAADPGYYPNRLSSYNRLKGAISKGRMAGMVSWTAIEDLDRNLMGLGTSESPKETLDRAVSSYRRDLWAEQEWRPEIWIEKKAGLGTIAGTCNELRVDYFATKGYNSQSEQWRAAQRMAGYIRKGQRPIIFHIGDHDPSGLDMTRDIRDRFEGFLGVPIIVQRIALNINQVEAMNLAPNPAKDSDARTEDYREEFGDSSWELDALPPEYIRKLIKDSVDRLRDEATWDRSLEREVSEKRQMALIAEQFGEMS